MEDNLRTGYSMGDYVELKEFAAILWRRKWLIVLVTLLAAAGAFAVSSYMSPIYEASTVLFVNQATDPRSSDFGQVPASERFALTYAEMLTTRPMLDETFARLELGADYEDPDLKVRAQLVKDTQLIELKVQHNDPIIAAAIANMVVEVFAEQFDVLQAGRFAASKASLDAQLERLAGQIGDTESQVEALRATQVAVQQMIQAATIQAATQSASEAEVAALETPQGDEAAVASSGTPQPQLIDRSGELERSLSELSQYRVSYTYRLLSFEELRMAEAQSTSSIVQVEPAEPPEVPILPRTMLNTLIAGVAGAVVAVGAAVVIDRSDDRIRSAEDVSRATRLPVIGYVADSRKLAEGEARQGLMLAEPHSALAESFRSLRTNLELGGAQGTPRAILVASPGQGDGKTTIAAQLAVSMAQGGKRVVLVDANLRKPRLHEYFGIESKLGLSDMLIDDLVPQVVAHQLVHWRLRGITSGRPVDNPAELMGSIMMLKVLARLRDQADVAIFDGPPFLVSESFILASKLEGVLIVMQPGKTREAVALRMMEQLDRAQANLIGVMMNRVPDRVAHGLAGDLIYGYGSEPVGRSSNELQGTPARRPVVLRRDRGPSDEEASH